MSRPVFILGLQRSGTTWLGNLLAAHPDVAAATDAAHRGIHESVFFSHFARAWDWTDAAARLTARQAFAGSDYGRLIGADTRFIADDPDPARYFAAAMDAFAGSRTVWVEKSPHHTRLAFDIARALPQARFVCVLRGSTGLIASRLTAYGRATPCGNARRRAILKGALSNGAHGAFLTRFARTMGLRARLLRYEDLSRDPSAVLPDLLDWLDLDAQVPLASAFAPNSSFSNPADRPRFTPGEDRLIKLGEALGARVPGRALAVPRTPVFPAWVWSDPANSHGARRARDRKATS